MAAFISIDENTGAISTELNRAQRDKGNSLLFFPDNYVVVDLETTGRDPYFSDIIEIGAIKYRNDIEVARFQSLVQPYMCQIPDYIEQLTGITCTMVKDAPTIEALVPEILSFIGDDILVAHNANFDVNFLYDAIAPCTGKPFKNDFVDTLRLSRHINKDLPNHKLNTLCSYYSISQTEAHRAIADCLNTHACYVELKAQANGSDEFFRSKRFNSMSQSIHASSDTFNPDSELFGKYVAFTGKLDTMTREVAMQKVADIGGHCCDGVTRQTNYLVLGNNDYCKSIRDGKSSKQKKAEKLLLDGYDIQVISENAFLDLLED